MQNVLLQSKGLYTFPQHLTQIPQGAMLIAKNIVIDRDGISESRRGFKIYGGAMGSGSVDIAKQIIPYKNRLLRHWGVGSGTTLDWDDGTGTFTSFAGTYAEVVLGTRIKNIEQNGNLYFTTNLGIKKLTAATAADFATTVITNAGGIKALDLTATLNSEPGFFNQESVIAYRLVWGVNDANNNEILGTPSSRTVIYNPLTPLLISDFNYLLQNLDTLNLSTGIHAQNYLSTYKVASNASAAILRTALVDLTESIDSDIPGFTTASAVAEVQTITTVADVSNSLNSTYFNINSGQNVNQYYIWYSNGSGIDPAPAGRIGFRVTFTTSDANTVIATKTNAVLSTITDFSTSLSGHIITVTNIAPGVSTAANDGVAPTGFAFAVTTSGSGGPVVTGTGPYTVTWTTTTDPTNIIQVGDVVAITGVTPSTYNSPTDPISYFTVNGVTSSTISYSMTTIPGIYLSGLPTIKRSNYENIPQPADLDPLPTTDELESLQTYYTNIVTALINEPSGIITTPSIFANNTATTSATVNLTFLIPQDVTTAYFYQIYRTAQTASGTGIALSTMDPGDEEQLVYEANPTSADLLAGSITIQDITPDSFRGANLYTNPQTGEGILQANDIPPIALDVTAYKGYTFYANTTTKYRLQFSLLSVSKLVSGSSVLTIANGITSNTYTFETGVAEVQTVTTVADVSGSLNSTYFLLNSGLDINKYYVWFNNGGGVDPAITGRTGIEVTYSNNDSNTTIATKLSNTLNVVSDFIIGISGHVVQLTNNTVGLTTAATDGAAPTGFAFVVTIPGAGEDASNKKILISTLSTPAQQVDESARSLVKVINSNPDESVYAFYLSGPTDVPGLILFEARELGTPAFYVLTESANTGSQFSPNLSPTNFITGISIANPTSITSAAHGLVTGNQIIISGSNSTPSVDGVYTITKTGTNTFTIPVHVTGSGTTGGWEILTDANAGTNEIAPNRIYYSKYQEPEAVPLVNTLDIGSKDQAILRIIALRDNLFVLKEDSIYRISGLEAPFTVSLFDSSTLIKASDSAVVLNNLIYMFSSQGIAKISDGQVQVVSRPIEDSLIKLITPQFTNFTSATFGIAYESDRSYWLFTVANTGDTFATQCFRYNTFTQTWTQPDLSKGCGIVNPYDNLMYLGATDTNFIEQERKNFDRTDFSDREFNLTLAANSVNGNFVTLPSITNVTVGDTIAQTQYLTISKFNQILSKLDRDSGLNGGYVTNLEAHIGDSPNMDVDALITQIANDTKRLSAPGATSSATYIALTPTPTDFPSIQTTFNSLVVLLNNDTGTGFKDYSQSSGSIVIESIIDSINENTSVITLPYPYQFLEGPITIYNHINCQLQFVPQYFQDVSMSKQVSESTAIFEDSSFTEAELSFATDLSGNFETEIIPGNGSGIFGGFVFGNGIFGGNGSGIPFRTLIPKQKQRCRYINVQFAHSTAREIFSLYGISLTYNTNSQRAWR